MNLWIVMIYLFIEIKKFIHQYLQIMQKEYKTESKQTSPTQSFKTSLKKIEIPRYSDKFKDIIAKSQLARLQNTRHKQKQQQPTQNNPNTFFFYRIKSIGVGAHSFVYLVQQQQTHLLLAQKSVTKQHAKGIFDDLVRQVKLLLHLNHENIIKLYHVYASQTHINLLLQFAQDSLFALKQRFTIFKEKEIVQVVRQLLLALKYLHQKNIVHADVKLENIMIANGTIKLCDFGLAHVTKQQKEADYEINQKQLQQVVGTLEYLPPEYVQGVDSGHARDIWAVGILAFEMLIGKHPFDGLKQSDKWAKLIKSPAQYYCEQMKQLQRQLGISSQKMQELASHIFVDWKKRWSAQQLLQLPCFNQNKN